MELKIDIGDEVTVTATVLKVLETGRVSVSIPSYNFPYAIAPPEKTKVGDKIAISGYVTRIDEDIGKLTFRIGGLITVDIKSIVAHRKNKTPAFKPLHDRPD